MYQYLLDNGMTREEYEWFGKKLVKSRCVMGNDYYVTNEQFVSPDETTTKSGKTRTFAPKVVNFDQN